MFALALLVAVDVAAAPLHTFHLPTYAPPGDAGSVDPATQLVKGEPVTLWSIACEPSTDATTFEDTSNLRCVPAKLTLPANVAGATQLAHLEKCFKTTIERAPDAVIKAVLNGDTDAVSNAIRARSKRTVVVTGTASAGEGGTQIEVQLNAGDVAIPDSSAFDPIDVTLVKAPSSTSIARDVRRHRYARALATAERAWKSAPSTKTAGNLAAVALLFGDAAKAKAVVDKIDAQAATNGNDLGDDEDVGYAQQNVDSARSFGNREFVLKDPC